jgi:hypothetical protein
MLRAFVTNTTADQSSLRLLLFSVLKYVTYATLIATGSYYTYYEFIAVPYLFPDGVSLLELSRAYPVTIDVWVWLIWLGVFELETSFIPAERLKGVLKWGLASVRVSCYLLGFSAFYGFFATLQLVYGFEPYSILDLCSLSGDRFSLMVDVSEFEPLNAENCLTLANAELYRLSGSDIIVDHETLVYSEQMAWSIVINGVAWWLVMAVLEGEYWLEQTERMTRRLALVCDVIKGIVYSTLFATGVYWGYASGWIDFVDSMAWIAAFALIEMNILGVDFDAAEISVEPIAVLEPGL